MTTYLYFHQRSIVGVRESELRETLWVLRTAFHEYIFDKQKAPRSLQDLLQEHDLREIPIDPITGSNSTWRIVPCSQTICEIPSLDGSAITQSEVRSLDVKSGSTKTGLNGRRYSEW
jgi:general secretion pathway protein G